MYYNCYLMFFKYWLCKKTCSPKLAMCKSSERIYDISKKMASIFFSLSLFSHHLFLSFPLFRRLLRDFYVAAGVATHRETNTTDGGSGFVIASDAVMHHTKVDGKRIARPSWCQSVFLGKLLREFVPSRGGSLAFVALLWRERWKTR